MQCLANGELMIKIKTIRFFSLHLKRLLNVFLKNQRVIGWSLMLLAIVIDRAFILHHFSMKYIDDDQSIMWNGALEYSKGNFFEPYFFGQDYNPMIESILAIPLIQVGFSYVFSLPFISSLLTLSPFLITSFFFFSKKKFNSSVIVLAIPLLLPPEFGLITSMPRGAVGGIFISFLGVFCFLKGVRGKHFLFSFFSLLGLVANPNSILLVLPFAIISLYRNSKHISFYLYSLAGAIVPVSLWFFATDFYNTHPEYLVHKAWKLDFSLGRIVPFHWDSLFGYITPLFWYTGQALFPLLLLLIYIGYKQKKMDFVLSVSGLLLFIFFALTINKVHDGIDSVFYSRGRMFLAVPVALSILVGSLKIRKRITVAILTIALVSFAVKMFYSSYVIQQEVRSDKEHNMLVIKVSELKNTCDLLKRRAEEMNANLIIVHHDIPEKHVLNYACPCLIDDLPILIEPKLDRRTWRLAEVDTSIVKNILFTGISEPNFKFDLLPSSAEYRINKDSLVTIGLINNHVSTEVLLRNIGLPMRAH